MNNYAIYEKSIDTNIPKLMIHLDNELYEQQIDKTKMIKKIVCIFTDKMNQPISLSKDTSVGFHRLDMDNNHHHHHHNNHHINIYNLGKKKQFFTFKKQEEEGLVKSEYIWILDFGWTISSDHRNDTEISFHFLPHEYMKLTMLVFYEDEEETEDFDFGWLQGKLGSISKTENKIVDDYILRQIIR